MVHEPSLSTVCCWRHTASIRCLTSSLGAADHPTAGNLPGHHTYDANVIRPMRKLTVNQHRCPTRHPPLRRRARCGIRVVAMVVALMTVASACSGNEEANDSRTVEVLWYGTQPDGSILGGTLQSSVNLRRLAEGVGIDVAGISASGAGEVWTASAWTAAVLSLLFYGGVPDGIELAIEVADTIDGPSAGGLITTAALADLIGAELQPGVSMTGTIYPNGAIGPVGGIPEKLRAARDAGLITVAVPDVKRRAVDPRTNEEVDVAELADELGIEVIFVKSLHEARAVLFSEDPLSHDNSEDVPVPSTDIESSFSEKAADLAGRLADLSVSDAPQSNRGATAESLRSVLDAERAAFKPGAPDTDRDLLPSYFTAAAVERRVLAWNAATEVTDLAATQGIDDAITELRRRATATSAAARQVALDVASTPVDSIEQLMAVVDVTEWATDAIEVAEAVHYRLGISSAASPMALGVFAGELATQDYHLTFTIDDVLSAALSFGATPLRGETLGELRVFTAVLEAAVDANTAVLRLKATGGAQTLDTDVLDAFEASDKVIAEVAEEAASEQARTIIVLADKISRYVATSKLLNLERTASSTDGLLRGLSLVDPDLFDAQIDLAVETSDMAARTVSDRGGDPGYFLWETQWAKALADGDNAGILDDNDRVAALSRLWFANINERILVALTRPNGE